MIIKEGQFEYISFPPSLAERVGTSWLYLGKGVLKTGLSDLSAKYRKGLLIADGNTWAAAGRQVKDLAGLELNTHLLEGEVHCDQEHLEVVLDKCKSADVLIALGSGTINDLCRLAAHSKNIPFWSIGTAPSMDGYLSANSSVIREGIKISHPNITPPEGTIIDLDILEKAPQRMLAAGIGDSLAKITSLFDWHFDSLIRKGPFDSGLADLLQKGLTVLMDLLCSEPETPEVFRVTIEFLLLSSAIMQVFRSSQPASGGEHLVSHIWEMLEQKDFLKASSLHGEKAGLAFYTVIAKYRDFLASPVLPAEGAINNRYEALSEWEQWGIRPDPEILKLKLKHAPGFSLKLLDQLTLKGFLLSAVPLVEKIYAAYSLPGKPEDLSLEENTFLFAVKHGGDIRDRITLMDWITLC